MSLQLGGSRLYRENQTDQKISTRSRLSTLQGFQRSVRGYHAGLAYLSALLERAKSEIASDGYISENGQEELFDAFGLWDYLFTLTCLSAGPQAGQAESTTSSNVEDKPAGREHADVVKFIDSQLRRIGRLKEHALEREKLALDAEARSFGLPPADATDKLLRYEAHLDRQLYRAMDQLERLQRQRKGERVPPPLSINLGKRS